jgi:hypothetical protein
MPASKTKKPSPRKLAVLTPQPFELRTSTIQGRGAFATRSIRKGARIIEYIGERISQEEADERYDDSAMRRHHTFLFNIDEDTVIDAAREGNDARFINHSCEPNCQAFQEGDRIFIYAKRDIQPGEELSYDYGYERTEDMGPEEEKLYVCRCGMPSCRGTILAPLKPPEEEKKKPAARKKGAASRKKQGAASRKKGGAARKKGGASRKKGGARVARG